MMFLIYIYIYIYILPVFKEYKQNLHYINFIIFVKKKRTSDNKLTSEVIKINIRNKKIKINKDKSIKKFDLGFIELLI